MRFAQTLALTGFFALPSPAAAHVSEQGFVLLLPTGTYRALGVITVLLTFAFILFFQGQAHRLFRRTRALPHIEAPRWGFALPFAALAALLLIGWFGPRDPLSNLLPLVFWTGLWILLLSLSGLAGNLWPFPRPQMRSYWPCIIVTTAFAAFMLADPAPDDPARLAAILATYLALTLLTRARAEAFSAIFRLFALSSPIAGGRIGLPGHGLLTHSNTSFSLGILALLLLGIGSFDGLNETFFWLAAIGVNPLEFPGRSAVIWPNLAGLAAYCLALIAAFTAVLFLGHVLARPARPFHATFTPFALTLMPITLGYHIAHYLPSFLVNIQYLAFALSDPLAGGADFLGFGKAYVTTGFFNNINSVRAIWLTQAVAVVGGHVLSLLVSHAQAERLFGPGRAARLHQLPLAVFMIGYTGLGLWLLAAPRGA